MSPIIISSLKDFYKFAGNDSFDVYDKNWDYGTTIVYDLNDEIKDGYDKFINYLVENTDFVEKIDNDTITADFVKFINNRKEVFHKFMEEHNRADYKPSYAEIDTPEAYTKEDFIEQMSVQTIISLLNGNYTDKDYDELMTLFEKFDKEKILNNVDNVLQEKNFKNRLKELDSIQEYRNLDKDELMEYECLKDGKEF